MQSAYDAYNDSAWDQYVGGAPYFLSVHKACNASARASTAACESFRLSMLLAAGGGIFSEHCHPWDEAAYEGLVTFGAVSVLAPAILAERALDAAAATARRNERLAAFEARFRPAGLFVRAGLSELLSTRGRCPS